MRKMSDAVVRFGALARKASRAAKRAPGAAVSEIPAAARVAELDKVPKVPFDDLGVLGLHSVGRLHEVIAPFPRTVYWCLFLGCLQSRRVS